MAVMIRFREYREVGSRCTMLPVCRATREWCVRFGEWCVEVVSVSLDNRCPHVCRDCSAEKFIGRGATVSTATDGMSCQARRVSKVLRASNGAIRTKKAR